MIFEYDSPQTLHASNRVIRTLRHYVVLRLGHPDESWVEARMTARLRGAGFGLTDIGHGRILVTPGSLDVDGIWRRAREVSRYLAMRDHATMTRDASKRSALIEAREDALCQAAARLRERAARESEDAELEHVTL